MAIAGVPAPSPDEPPLSARRERTRERLLDAAFDVFSRLGVHAASIETICDAAGFTRGAFYSNFASKEELLLALVDRHMRAHLASLEATVDELGDSVVDDHGVRPDALRTVVAAVLGDRDDQRRWHLVQTEFELMALRDPQIGAQYNEQQERIRQELLDALGRVLARLGLRFVIPEPEAVDILVGTYVFGVQQGFLAGGQEADDGGAAALLGPLTQLLVTEA
ncbi:TetR/AcrR family transcriptional regulator [Georgenia deserti]|uniref:TetR/AcrR family transcriptional regulator n=1 Tax=Georgenia deserti TaxID=2093781 RepID=A0ABW4L2B5_9MICO